MGQSQDTSKIQVLDRALGILDLLMASKIPMGVNQIAKAQGITPSAAFRILKTLTSDGWVFQCRDDKYIPGQKISFVTEKDNFFLALSEVAYPVMQKLTANYVLPMNLAVRQGQRLFILQQTRSTRYVDFVPPIGTDLPVHASAGGKLLLSEMPECLCWELLDTLSFTRMTEYTICSREAFVEELHTVREQGFAVDYFESLENTCCIGVPVRNRGGEIVAALSFSGITGMQSPQQLRDLFLPALKAASLDITNALYSLKEAYDQNR